MTDYKKCTVVNLHSSPFEVLICRGTEWGNPFHIGKDGNREEVVWKFKRYFYSNPKLLKMAREELKGKVLG